MSAPTSTIVRREARAVAAAIDLLVIAAIGAICLVLAVAVMLAQVNPAERDPSSAEWAAGYAVGLSWLLFSSLYAGLGARTLGSRVLGFTEHRPTERSFITRALLWWPSLLLLGVGLWWPWLDRHGRSLPEVLCGSTLVETPPT